MFVLQSDESNSLFDDSNSAESAFKGKLFKRYKIQEKYGDLYPAVVDPKDENKYFAMTMEKVDYWASHRVRWSMVFLNRSGQTYLPDLSSTLMMWTLKPHLAS